MNLSTATNFQSLLSVSPQTVIVPVSYTIVNILPFNQPVYVFLYLHLSLLLICVFLHSASTVTFVGLIYSLIMTFFVVVSGFIHFWGALEHSVSFQAVALGAREASRLNQILRYRSLVTVRLMSSFIAYFFLSVCQAPLIGKNQTDAYFSSFTRF